MGFQVSCMLGVSYLQLYMAVYELFTGCIAVHGVPTDPTNSEVTSAPTFAWIDFDWLQLLAIRQAAPVINQEAARIITFTKVCPRVASKSLRSS